MKPTHVTLLKSLRASSTEKPSPSLWPDTQAFTTWPLLSCSGSPLAALPSYELRTQPTFTET